MSKFSKKQQILGLIPYLSTDADSKTINEEIIARKIKSRENLPEIKKKMF